MTDNGRAEKHQKRVQSFIGKRQKAIETGKRNNWQEALTFNLGNDDQHRVAEELLYLKGRTDASAVELVTKAVLLWLSLEAGESELLRYNFAEIVSEIKSEAITTQFSQALSQVQFSQPAPTPQIATGFNIGQQKALTADDIADDELEELINFDDEDGLL